jgi:hypothetical protein
MLEEGLDVVALKKIRFTKSSSDLKNWNIFKAFEKI